MLAKNKVNPLKICSIGWVDQVKFFLKKKNIKGNVKKNGWVLDLDDLDKYLKKIIVKLDHSLLNDIKGLSNPTCENIAKWIWKILKKDIKNLDSIEVYRPRVGGCIFFGK